MKVVLWFLMMLMPLMANASSVNEEQLFHRLDSYIAQRSKFTQRKEAKLLRLKSNYTQLPTSAASLGSITRSTGSIIPIVTTLP